MDTIMIYELSDIKRWVSSENIDDKITKNSQWYCKFRNEFQIKW
jgi:hypothetical protein